MPNLNSTRADREVIDGVPVARLVHRLSIISCGMVLGTLPTAFWNATYRLNCENHTQVQFYRGPDI
jgi:hypothetical protein